MTVLEVCRLADMVVDKLEWLQERREAAGMLPDGSFVVPNSWLEPILVTVTFGAPAGPSMTIAGSTDGANLTPINLWSGETKWSRILPVGTEVSGAEPKLWSVRPVSVLRDMIVEWADVCEGCAAEAHRAMDMAQQVGALQVVIVICGAESEGGYDAMEEAAAAAAHGAPSCVACVDGDEIVVLPDDASIERFIAWCRENVSW